jgi:tetratricopeptide (TPR) repeat protein
VPRRRATTSRRFDAVALVLAVLASAAPSRAEAPPGADPPQAAREEAQRALTEGNRLFRERRFDDAVKEYRRAYAIDPKPKLHFNIGVAERMRGNHVEAAAELDQFLDGAKEADPDMRADAVRYLAELAATVATVKVQGLGPGSALVIDGEPFEDTGGQRPIRLTPGRHEVVVRRSDGSDWGRTLELAAGASVTVVPEMASAPAPKKPLHADHLALAVQPATPIEASRERPLYGRWWFWTAVAGVVGAGVGAYALWGGHSDACVRSNNCIVVGP